FHDLGQHAQRRLPARFRAPAMVGDDDAVDAVAQRFRCVLAGHDALQYQLVLYRAAQAVDEPPRHPGAVEVRDFLDVDTLSQGLAPHLVREPAGRMADRALPGVLEPEAKEGFGVAPALAVDRKDDSRRARRLSALYERLRHVPIVGRIQHVPDRRAVLLRALL